MDYLRSRLWSVEADGRDEYVMEAWAKYNSKLDPGGPYAFANIEVAGPVRLRIRALDGRDLGAATVRPARAPANVVSRNGAEMTIEVAGPCKFAVETDDVTKCGALMVFVNSPVAPPEDGPKVKRFGPGIHRVPGGLVRLKDGETLYLEKGAVLQSAVSARGEGIRICGLGVIDLLLRILVRSGRALDFFLILLGDFDLRQIVSERLGRCHRAERRDAARK